MFEIDEKFRDAVCEVIEHGGSWHHGKNHITSQDNGKTLLASYFDDANPKWSESKHPHDNEIFWYSKKTGDFWFSNCGYLSRTTKLRINDCFAAIGLPWSVYVSKGRFCIRNTHSSESWICGDGKITRAELEKHFSK